MAWACGAEASALDFSRGWMKNSSSDNFNRPVWEKQDRKRILDRSILLKGEKTLGLLPTTRNKEQFSGDTSAWNRIPSKICWTHFRLPSGWKPVQIIWKDEAKPRRWVETLSVRRFQTRPARYFNAGSAEDSRVASVRETRVQWATLTQECRAGLWCAATTAWILVGRVWSGKIRSAETNPQCCPSSEHSQHL